MTVAELIVELSKVDQSLTVFTWGIDPEVDYEIDDVFVYDADHSKSARVIIA